MRGLIAGDGGRASWSFVGDSLAGRDLRARHLEARQGMKRHRSISSTSEDVASLTSAGPGRVGDGDLGLWRLPPDPCLV